MRSVALLPANVQSSLTRLDRADRQAKIGQLLNPTAARTTARPVGTAAAGADFFDRMGPALMRAVQTLLGQPPVQPTVAGQIPRNPWPMPQGVPDRVDFSAGLTGSRPWQPIAESAQRILGDAEGLLQRMEDGTATSQAELVAMQQKFTKANMMFEMASRVMKQVHDTQKAMINNLRP